MTEWLLKHCVKNYQNTDSETVRTAYGTLSSVTGMLCNVFLFAVKFAIGMLTQSISITSDAFNNLSDCMSCLVTLFGYKLAAKPADKEHPFGHGRMEYVVSFIVAIIIFIVGYELFSSSIDKIIHPQSVIFSWPLFIILAASILVKLWMSLFNKTLGRKINNIGMIATAQDSRNDVIATAVTLLALFLSKFVPSIPVDGIAGLIVSGFIFYSGYGISKDIIGELLGNPADQKQTTAIKNMILSYPEVLGVHDMIIHDYGPGKELGSAHVEVDSQMNFLKAHDVVDQAERKIYEKMHVMMTLHLDPVDTTNPVCNAYRDETSRILHEMDPNLSMHDFRIVSGPTHTNLVFDVMIPYECKYTKEEIQKRLDEELTKQATQIYTVITFDHEYTQEQETKE